MSVFDDTPHPFPLNVGLRQRPAEFRLVAEPAERGAILMLSVFWGLAIPATLLAYAEPWAPWAADGRLWVRLPAMLALIAFVAVGYTRWLGPMVIAMTRRVDVRIDETDVAVRERGLLGTRRWSCPIAEFAGLAIEDWGRLQREDRSALRAVVLRHPDERRSIPLIVDPAHRVKPSAAAGKAAQLGLPVLEAPTPSADHGLPEGTLVMNRWQAIKVRILHVFLFALGLGIAGWMILLATTQPGPMPLLGAAAALALAAAMHLFAMHYVVSMRIAGSALLIETAAPLHAVKPIPVDHLRRVERRAGRFGTGTRLPVEAPWLVLTVDGYRVPFVVDLQAEHVDVPRLEALAGRRKS